MESLKVSRIALLGVLLFALSLGFTACSVAPKEDADSDGLPKVSFQLDWLPEAALGGFFIKPFSTAPMKKLASRSISSAADPLHAPCKTSL